MSYGPREVLKSKHCACTELPIVVIPLAQQNAMAEIHEGEHCNDLQQRVASRTFSGLSC